MGAVSAKAVPQDATRPARTQTDIPHDEAFDLLSNHRRRYALHYLQRERTRVDLGELAVQIAAWENETRVRDVSSAERKRVYTALQQIHLPRMDEAGVVEFDDRAGTVTLGPAAEDLDFYLEVVDRRDLPWSQYYLLLAVANAALLVGALVWGTPVSSGAAGAFAVTTFALSALVHAYYGRTEMQLGASEEPQEVRR